MTNDLLLLVKSDNSQKLEFEKVDLSKVVKKQMAHMQAHAKQKNITLKTNIQDDCVVKGSNAHLKRLLTNLVQNAIDYNKPHGEIQVSMKKQAEQIKLKITDTGIGIPEKDLPNIFDRFYKVDQARTKQSGGAGLGLSIVKEIVEMHAAQISIESKLNKGTTITILFPLSQRLYS